ncbi:MAG: M42 family peptidase, partial [Oscillospiraceae bacterium]
DNGVVLLFATREEMGGQGAMTGSFGIQPDFAVAVDVTYAEAPDVTKEQGKPLGSGPAVGYSSLLDYEISKMLCDIAKAHN